MSSEFETVVFDGTSASGQPEGQARPGGSRAGSATARHGRGRGRRRAVRRSRRLAAVAGAVAAVAVTGGAYGALAASGGPASSVVVGLSSPAPAGPGAASPALAPSVSATAPTATAPASTAAPSGSAAPTAAGAGAPATPNSPSSPAHTPAAHPSTAAPAPRTAAAPVAGAGAAPGGGTAAQFAQQIVDQVNAERAKAGCKPLTVNAKLQAAAQGHSDDMAARDYYEHDTPEGVDPGTRMTNAGYAWQSWGENIYESPKDPATAMTGWMNSPEHRDNILNCTYTQTGVGVNLSANGPWWTEDFAQPQ